MPKAVRHQQDNSRVSVERVQLGVRMEKNLVKILKALAEFKDMSLTEFLESIVLHSFTPIPGEEGEKSASPLSKDDIQALVSLRKIYSVTWDAHSFFRFTEEPSQAGQ